MSHTALIHPTATHRGIAVALLAIIVMVWCPDLAGQENAANRASTKLDLKILFVGEPDTERSEAFVSYLKQHTKDVITAPLDGSAGELAKDVDVVVLDWLYDMESLDKRPIGERADWTKPTVLVGQTGVNLANSWRLHGGFG